MSVRSVNKQTLIAFEAEVAKRFEAGEIRGPVHLSGGNEDQLIEIFQGIKPADWVFSTWRNHYHALLHGIPEDKVMAEIMAGRSMNMMFPEHNFFTSAIVGGILPIAVGVAAGIGSGHVWCFIGDMTANSGMMDDCAKFATFHQLPITFIVEDNNLSCNTPTKEITGYDTPHCVETYHYTRQYPHVGIGKWIHL